LTDASVLEKNISTLILICIFNHIQRACVIITGRPNPKACRPSSLARSAISPVVNFSNDTFTSTFAPLDIRVPFDISCAVQSFTVVIVVVAAAVSCCVVVVTRCSGVGMELFS